MKFQTCVACGSRDDLQHHHLITRAEGGSDDETNLITLCHPCHAKLHKRQLNGVYSASERTKAALVAVKARIQQTGQEKRPDIKRLGNPDLGAAQLLAVAATRAEADRFAETMRPTLAGLGDISASAMARELNERRVPTANGGKWSATTVLRLQQRLKEISGRNGPS